jgi:trimeric autotransporter adhesin
MPLFNPSGEGNIVSGSGNTTGTLTTFNSGTVILAGGNNITLSQSSNSISIIGAAGGTGGAAITLGASNLGHTSGTSGVISGSALQYLFAGGNNVTLSQSLNGSSITITVSAANQSNQQISGYAVSNTTLQTSATLNASNLSFGGAGGVSVGISNGSVVISGGAGGGGGNNTLGMSNLGNTSGTTGVISGSAVELFLAGGNNVTLSQSINGSTATITVSAANQTNQSLGLYASSQTTGQSSSSTVDARSLSIVGAGNISVGMSGGSLVVSGNSAAAGTLSGYAVSNTTLGTSGTIAGNALSFEGAGNVSVGVSNGSVVISGATVAGATNLSAYAVSNTTLSTSATLGLSNLSIEGAGGVSVGVSNGSLVISSPQNSTITQGNMVTISTNGQTVTIDAFANILSASGNTSGTLTTFSSGTMVLAGGANITLSQSSNTITISGAAGGGGGTLSMFAVSNTTQSTSGSVAATALSFNGAGNVSVGVSAGSVVISGKTQSADTGGVYASSNTFGTSSGSYDARTLSIAGSGAVSVAASNSGWVISAPVQTNQTLALFAGSNTTVSTSGTVDARSFSMAGAGAISIEASNSGYTVSSPVESFLIAGNNISLSSNSNSITIANLLSSGPVSQYEPWAFGANSSLSSLGQSSLYLQHLGDTPEMQICRMNRLVSLSMNAAVSASTNATGTRSNVWNYNETVGLFTRGTGTNSTALYSYTSQTWSFGITESVSIVLTNATQASLAQSYTLGFIGQIDTAGGTTSSTFSSASGSSSAGTTVSQANVLSNVTGIAVLNNQLGSMALSGGDYWLALVGASAVTSGGTASTQASFSQCVLTNFVSDLKKLGQTATATSNTLVPGNGAYTAQTGAFPSSIPFASISNNSNVSLYGNLMNLSL